MTMNRVTSRVISAGVQLLSVGLLMTVALSSQAAPGTGTSTDASTDADSKNDDTTAYVDSIHKWGAWELDIEPAAGGVQPTAGQPLMARDSRIRLRTNSIAALAPTPPPPHGPQPPVTPPQTPPTVPPAPPPVPTITPVSPDVPIPVGGPADAF